MTPDQFEIFIKKVWDCSWPWPLPSR
jgi:hypothetical protein